MTAAEPPLLDGAVLAGSDPPALAASRCSSCSCVAFPAQQACSRCGATRWAGVVLPDIGVVWSWTVQHHPPKPPYESPPDGFRPFALGYVDLGEVLVEALLVPPDHPWRIGEPVRLTLTALPGAEGDVLTYAFTAEQP